MAQSSNIPFTFGNFDWLCKEVALPLCPLVGPNGGIQPYCYARPLDISNNKMIFEPAVLLVYIVAVLMTLLMIFHVRNKYTGVGRKEMTPVFYFYAAAVLVDLFLVAGIVDATVSYYKYIVAAQIALTFATAWTLFVNSFVGFQWMEDGTLISVILVWSTGLLMGAGAFMVSFFTFNNSAGFSASKPLILHPRPPLPLLPRLFILVLVHMRDKWPIFNLFVALILFSGGQAVQYIFGRRLCEYTSATLLGMMMVYKFWDDLTKEDFEFSVNHGISNWEVKEPLLGNHERV
ncbi:chitin synthase III catalytic subunit [Chytridium lagenaria]|nr:chitin synthase III catalytic subunit [Chytridium lagenaria]